jgi:hypothetical protein
LWFTRLLQGLNKKKKEKMSIICIRDESCRLTGGRLADKLRRRIKGMGSHF